MPLLALALAAVLASAPPPAAGLDDGICAPQVHVAEPAQCPPVGPGAYAADFAGVAYPDAPPDLPLGPLARYDPVVDYTYARVTTPDAPLFASPADGVAGASVRTLGKGFIFVNVLETVDEAGQTFHRIRTGEYLRAADVTPVEPSKFQGLLFEATPQYPVAWIVSNVRPSARPGVAAPTSGPRLYRKQVVQLFATQRVGDWDW